MRHSHCIAQRGRPAEFPFAAKEHIFVDEALARQRGVELPLVISDHADWSELTQTIRDVGAPEVWITHCEADALAHWCGLNGVRAKPLHLVGYGDESEPAPEAA